MSAFGRFREVINSDYFEVICETKRVSFGGILVIMLGLQEDL